MQGTIRSIYLFYSFHYFFLSLLYIRCEYLMQSRGQEYINHVQQSSFNTFELAVCIYHSVKLANELLVSSSYLGN